MNRGVLTITLLIVLLSTPEGSNRLALEVVARDTIVWRAGIEPHEPFDITFVHSSEGCPWTQHYRAAQAGHIEQVASTFACFGAGMPIDSTDGAAIGRSPEGYTVAAPALIGDLAMMAWQRGHITLAYRGRRIPIGQWFADFERVTVRIR
jgi:hypothetical protein